MTVLAALAGVVSLAATWLVSLRWYLSHQATMAGRATDEHRQATAALKGEVSALAHAVRDLEQRAARR